MESAEKIASAFPITEEEFKELDKKYNKLCHFVAWQLYKKNSKSSYIGDHSDMVQDLYIALMRAGSYYKRQKYIENCLDLCAQYAEDGFLKLIIQELQDLWKNKTRHGANRQKFGPYQEKLLRDISEALIPGDKKPSKSAPLCMDAKFNTYAKSIAWNEQKARGRKITREKGIRQGMASLSDFDYLGVDLKC